MTTAQELGRPLDILLVEDSPTDALLAKEALKRSKVDHVLHHVEDGVEAMKYLCREAPYVDATRPDVVLLDLNMPRKSGREVLAAIRSSDSLRRLPVLILTTSADSSDVNAAYEHFANCYITKPVDLSDFIEAMQALGNFTLTWVSLPTEP